MDRIVYYSEELEPEIVQQVAKEVLPNTEVVACYSKRRLVESLIDEPELVGMILDASHLDSDWVGFLQSATTHFPLLPILILAARQAGPCPEGFSCVDRDSSDEDLATALSGAFGQSRSTDRREHHRYDWPLRAELTDERGVFYSVHELSAGGAFLEPMAGKPESGSFHDVDIFFQNFKIRTRCAILDGRDDSGSMPLGFGVRFDNLSASASEFVNRVVEDAIMQVLTDPASEPAIPSIEEEEDVLAIGDEFSLM